VRVQLYDSSRVEISHAEACAIYDQLWDQASLARRGALSAAGKFRHGLDSTRPERVIDLDERESAALARARAAANAELTAAAFTRATK